MHHWTLRRCQVPGLHLHDEAASLRRSYMEVTHVNTARCVVALLRMSLKTVSVAPLTVFLSENDGFLARNTQLFTKNGVFYKTLGKIFVHVDQKTVSVTPLTVF